MLIGSTSGSWSGAVMQSASAVAVAALSHAGPSSGSGPVQRAVIVAVAFALMWLMRAFVRASVIAEHVDDGQSALVAHGAPTATPPAHCGRHTALGGRLPFDRRSSHDAIAFSRALE